MLSLRPYQKTWCENVRSRRDAGSSRLLVVAATGSGKGAFYSALPEALGLTKRLLILTHLETLAEQAVRKLQAWNPTLRIGLEMANSFAGDADVVVGSIPTLGKANSTRLQALDPDTFEVVVIDEAHHLVAPTWQRVLQHFGILKTVQTGAEPFGTAPIGNQPIGRRPILMVGLTATATPEITKFFDEVVAEFPTLTAIEQGWLSDLVGVQIKTRINLNKVKVRHGDLDPAQLDKAINIKIRNKLVVDSWLSHAKSLSSLVFCSSVAHSQSQAKEFQDTGVACEAIWGHDPLRYEKLRMFTEGKLQVLCNMQILCEGWDYPNLQCICMARPTQSNLLYKQMLGRGARLQDGINNLIEAKQLGTPLIKERCLVLDFTDNCTKHSLMSLPLVFGLSPNLNLAGQSVVAATQKVKQFKEKHPNIDLSKIEVITELESYIERVDLFRGAQTAQQCYVPSWVKSNALQTKRYNLARFYARGVLSQEQLNHLTEGQVWAILNAKAKQMREVLKEQI